MLSRLFIAALWSPAEKGLTSWLLFVIVNCVFVAFPCAIMGQVYLIVSIPDLCRLSYFEDQFSLNAGRKYRRMEHSAILATVIKLTLVIEIFVLSFFEWPFYTSFTAL